MKVDPRSMANQQASSQQPGVVSTQPQSVEASRSPGAGFTAVNTPISSAVTTTNKPLSTAPATVSQPTGRPIFKVPSASQPAASTQRAPGAAQLDGTSTLPIVQKRKPSQSLNSPSNAKPFRRSITIWPDGSDPSKTQSKPHFACGTPHEIGHCPIKLAGPEFCNLCGLAHFGISRTCPHIQSETQVRAMLQALKQSTEPRALVQEATKYLNGVKGTLGQSKKIKAAKLGELQKARALQNGEVSNGAPPSSSNVDGQGDQAARPGSSSSQPKPQQPGDVERANEHLRHALPGHRPSWMTASTQ